jgi:hypothetical protein
MKVYTDQEIDDLVKEVQEQILSPIFKAAQDQIAKSEGGKQMPAPKEGGNGTVPQGASMAKEEASMSESSKSERSEGSKSEGSAPFAKEESSLGKEESAPGKEASDEKSKEASPAPALPEGSSEGSGSEGSHEAPAPSEDPAMEDAHVDAAQLAEAYGALDDGALQAHFEALKQVLTQRMGAGQDPAAQGQPPAPDMGAPPPAPEAAPDMGAPPPDMGAAPPAAAPGSPGVPPPPAPAEKAMPGPTMAPAAPKPMMRSEAAVKEEALNKAEVESLKTQVAGLTKVLETMLKPQRKSVATMAEFLAKSDADAPKKALSKDEIRKKLEKASKTESLAKSDQDLICRYFLQGDVKVEDLTHLLKDTK